MLQPKKEEKKRKNVAGGSRMPKSWRDPYTDTPMPLKTLKNNIAEG